MTLAREKGRGLTAWVLRGRAHVLNYALTPMLMRDLRSITRGRRPLFVQLAYLALTGLVMVVAALVCHAEQASNAAWGGPADSLLYGQYMFIGIFEAQVVLLALVVISSAAGAVSLEFEKRTYDMLAVTTLTSVELVAGKILSITLLGGMLLFTSLPLAAICLLVGGISPGQIVLCYGLLLAALPLWASSCVLISTLVRRTINSTVVCLVWMVGLIVVASCLSIPDSSYPCVGIMNPMLAVIFDDYASFRVLGHAFPVWAAPLLLDGLLTLFFLVAAAEALPLRQPSRSAVLRLLSMACFFSLAFFIYSAMIFPGFPRYGSNSPPDFWPTLAGGLRNAWVIGIVSLLVVCSYPPPRDAYARPLAWMLGWVPLRRWFARDTAVGWRFALLFFALGLLAIAAPMWGARAHHALPGALPWPQIGFALLATALYALSVFGFACWTTAAGLHWRDRRYAACAVSLLFVAGNFLTWIYEGDPYSFMRVQLLAHPAVQTVSPMSAVQHWLSVSPVVFCPVAWKKPVFTVALPLLYQVLFVVAGLVSVHWEARSRSSEGSN